MLFRSTSFMSLSPSSTGNLIFGLLTSGLSSCLTSLNFWTTILNLRSYSLTLKTMPLFPWALLITGLTESVFGQLERRFIFLSTSHTFGLTAHFFVFFLPKGELERLLDSFCWKVRILDGQQIILHRILRFIFIIQKQEK